MKKHFDALARDYDRWFYGQGQLSEGERPGWDEELAALEAALRSLPPARTLDVACGTGYVTRWLPGEVTGIDQSEAMIEVASRRLPRAQFVVGDALSPPFAAGAFERVHTSHFYGHLLGDQREQFVATAARLAPPRLQALVHRGWPRRGARRRGDRPRGTVVRRGQDRTPEPAVLRERAGARSPIANRAGSGASPRSAAAISSAIAGPCLKPCPEPAPSSHVRSSSGWRPAMKCESGESS